MVAYVLLGTLKKVCHQLLGQPYRFILKPHIQLQMTIFGLIHQKLPFGSFHCCVFRAFRGEFLLSRFFVPFTVHIAFTSV